MSVTKANDPHGDSGLRNAMPDPPAPNHRVILAARPHGAPVHTDFRSESLPIPLPTAGQLLTRTLYLSPDPYVRGRMSDAPSYAPAVRIGDVMVGGTVSRVETSHHAGFAAGDLVLGYSGWQEYALSGGNFGKLVVRMGTA